MIVRFDRLLAYADAVSAEREDEPMHRLLAELEPDVDPVTGTVTFSFTSAMVAGPGELRRRSTHRRTLARLGWQCRDSVQKALEAGPELDRELLMLIEASGSPRLVRLLLDATASTPDPWRRCGALQVAYFVRPSTFRGDFIEASRDPRVEVREMAVSCLSSLVRRRGAADVVGALLEVAADEHAPDPLRCAALGAPWWRSTHG